MKVVNVHFINKDLLRNKERLTLEQIAELLQTRNSARFRKKLKLMLRKR